MSSNRRQHILEVLANELETKPGSRITTAALAAAVGVSEAALYRHFASKAKMFEALIEFAETSVFGLINRILEEQSDIEIRCYQITTVVLKFAERNPGIARILLGDVLLGEHPRLRQRARQIFARLETQLNQLLREWAAREGEQKQRANTSLSANLLVAVVVGHIAQFVHTEFTVTPSDHWDDQWRMLTAAMFD